MIVCEGRLHLLEQFGMTRLFGLWFFGEIEDQYSFFKPFVRLRLMPFSVMLPRIRGFEKEIYWFLFIWFLWDVLVSFIFAVDVWVAIIDTRWSGRDIVKEGHLGGESWKVLLKALDDDIPFQLNHTSLAGYLEILLS
ncbi:hypothetical protein PVL29_017041 [Vitis rotundifolia]|uniref:Uncharacterized protein n=1 Tax=Vitis rotundifolia TaxID=103349 RepID=A0AA38Z9E2_VITRO|nr:hypothetical protein PVL29_017041 [Vitis rotundifolia]